MKYVIVENQYQNNSKIPVNPLSLCTIFSVVICAASDIIFMPILICDLVTSFAGFCNVMQGIFFIVLILAKYSMLFVQIYGLFFDSQRNYRSCLALVDVLLEVTIGVLLLCWTIMLIGNGGTVLMVITDPILLYLLIGGVLCIPGLMYLYLS